MNDITIDNIKIPYRVRESSRAKRLQITVHPGGDVVVTQPKRNSQLTAIRFLEKNAEWVLKKYLEYKDHIVKNELRGSRREYLAVRESVRRMAKERLHYYNQFYGYEYNRVSIKDLKSQWGSCSYKKNLNFNYRILHLPEHLCDYILVHELCHLGEMNHSHRFWALVEKTVPNYKKYVKELREEWKF